MDSVEVGSPILRLGPRIMIRDEPPARLQARKDCVSTSNSDTCEKPQGQNTMVLPIVLGVVIPVCVVAAIIFYLHHRNVKRQRAEDIQDPHKDLDFGLDLSAADKPGKRGKRRSMFGYEKPVHRPGQLSMDMNLSSPYLLPPGAHSKESLSQGFPEVHDPYRLVPHYVNSETGSIRSFGAGKEGSMYNGSTKHASTVTGRSIGTSRFPPPPRQNSLPKSPTTPTEKIDPFATPSATESNRQVAKEEEVRDSQLPVQPVVPEIGVAYPDADHLGAQMPDIRSPPPIMPKDPQERLNSPPSTQSQFPQAPHHQDSIGVAQPGGDFPLPPSQQGSGLGLDFNLPKPPSPPTNDLLPQDNSYSYYDEQPQIHTSEYHEHHETEERGRAPRRQDSLGFAQQQPVQDGLGVPQQDNKRLSVGFRPLPPADELESEDPEYRANRIRSFYKEYFDDSKEAAPAVPAIPQYYEDYDQSYLGDAAYYDADTNTFVMPYAQPVTRRAMTPPPAGRNRGPPGPRGPPRRGPHGPRGSLGGMSLPGGPGRPRAGSAFSPRPGSSASARMGRPGPKKKLPPPSALYTLPTPSKLKDDSFAIMNAVDFAPPDSIADRAQGRSQSPLGERRAYQLKVPAASPLVSAFDEMSTLPSPHLLRKSNTFTNLDFAPPKKFKDADTMSDAGSIRSNRSGISTANLSAIRGGAGRVSRLPEDVVFTQAALGNQLKPQWDMNR
ncbi:hypothetical protein NLU13_6182 [Sarocladium strictum]|uniref:Uncharacterized protein n=1 Tax=Sarocladium strictum TaxID=5046 RepID=A0AA39L716_SARSR|nr:hypothetical protein NLU13_6182 [Sarocladium strictum]